jgi:KAP family P-loop domain
VTAGRFLLVYGLVNRKLETMLLSDVTDLTMRRSLPGRRLGYGYLLVEHDLPDQGPASVSFVPYPSEVYLASWLAPDPRELIKDLVLRICSVVGPVSPFKVVRLLEQTSGDQGRDSPAVARELLYRTVADRLDEDRSLERRPELRSHLADYRNYLRRRNNTENARWSARHLTLIAVMSAIALGVLFGIEHYPSVRPISLGWALSLFIAAASVSVLLIALIWLLTQRIDWLNEQVASTAGRVHDEMLNDFKAISSVLSVELQRASTDPMLQLSAAPALIELESARVQPFASFKDVVEFLESHRTSAVGVGGRRGIGKTALLRWIKYELEPKWIVIYIPAPATYDAADFVRTIFVMTAKEVIQKYSVVLSEGRRASFTEPFRQLSNNRRIGGLSQQALDSITGARSYQRTSAAGIAGKGMTLQRGRQSTWTQRERSHPELIAGFKEYLEQYRLWGGRPVAIVIDELDKLQEADEAIAAVNGLKDLFHIPNTHFVVSVSEDALRRFAMRGVPFRDVFDSAFDTIVKLDVPSPGEAREMLARRSGELQGFPMPVVLFCYAWSGGVPRDIIRAARACVTIRNRKGAPVGVSGLAPQIIRQDVADIVDDAVNGGIEIGGTADIGGLLSLQHRLRDESLSLQAVLEGYSLNDEAYGESTDAVTLDRISKYMEIGSATLEFFSEDIYDLLTAHSEQVLCVVEDLARAKAALAVSPVEAEWYLSRARTKMGSSANGWE